MALVNKKPPAYIYIKLHRYFYCECVEDWTAYRKVDGVWLCKNCDNFLPHKKIYNQSELIKHLEELEIIKPYAEQPKAGLGNSKEKGD